MPDPETPDTNLAPEQGGPAESWTPMDAVKQAREQIAAQEGRLTVGGEILEHIDPQEPAKQARVEPEKPKL